MKFHTIGGVISPGTPILELVPKSGRLIVDARIEPNDIDVVREGQPALVRFQIYNQRNLPRLDGKVIYVAADSLIDEETGDAYFAAKIEIDSAEAKRLMPGVELTAGVPADVLIRTGMRTALEYALDPVVQLIR